MSPLEQEEGKRSKEISLLQKEAKTKLFSQLNKREVGSKKTFLHHANAATIWKERAAKNESCS